MTKQPIRGSRGGLPRWLALALLVGLATLLVAESASACSVCFGDPNSSMVKGVQAGVLVLLGVVGVVLTGLGSLILFWMRRAANLQAVPVLEAARPRG